MAAPPPASSAWRRVTIRCTRGRSSSGTRMRNSSGRSGMRGFLSIRPGLRRVRPGRRPGAPSTGPRSRAADGLHPSHSLSPGGRSPSASSPARRCMATISSPVSSTATIWRWWPSTIAVWQVAGVPSPRVFGVDLLGPHPDAHALAGRRLAHDAADAEARGADRATRPSPSRSSVPSRWFMSPMKSATNGRRRPVVDLRGRGELVDVARVHDGDAVGHRHRLLLVVRDHDEGDADVALDPLELDLHRLAQLEVERAERLVEQQHLRVHDERAGERDALLHAARELRGLGLLAPGEAHQLERLVGLLVALLLADLALLEAVGDVVEHGHVREQRVGLEDRVDVALVRRDADRGARRRSRSRPRSARRSRRSCAASSSCRSPRGRAGRGTRPGAPRGRSCRPRRAPRTVW